MEPATTQVWAEMLNDRKFANPISNTPEPANTAASFFLRGQGEPFKFVGPEDSVAMDAERPFVAKHSPRVRLNGAEPRGIQQSKLRVNHSRAYEGYVYLAGDPGAEVIVRLIWGKADNDSQAISITALSREYKKFPFMF